MKQKKVKCELCPRNKQYSKIRGYKCICCDANMDHCKHQNGTVQEQEVAKWDKVKAELWYYANPFTNEREKITRIRHEKIMYLWEVVKRMHYRDVSYMDNHCLSPLLVGDIPGTNDKDLRKGIIEKEWQFTWPVEETWLTEYRVEKQREINLSKHKYHNRYY